MCGCQVKSEKPVSENGIHSGRTIRTNSLARTQFHHMPKLCAGLSLFFSAFSLSLFPPHALSFLLSFFFREFPPVENYGNKTPEFNISMIMNGTFLA